MGVEWLLAACLSFGTAFFIDFKVNPWISSMLDARSELRDNSENSIVLSVSNPVDK